MTLPTAPSAISFNDISLELFCSVQSFNLNDSYGRCVVNLPAPNSTISLSNFYGKTAPISVLATCVCGGWYMGCTTACGVNYYLLAAPATPGFQYDYYRCGCSVCANIPLMAGGPIGTNPTAAFDGYCITKYIQACPNYSQPSPVVFPVIQWPLINKVWNLSINGFSDWYLPAVSEIVTMFCNTDLTWKCGGCMKSTGNQFPICGVSAVPAPSAAAPGCWPYLGYTATNAPNTSLLAFCCNNPWNPSTFTYPGQTSLCLQCMVGATQASGNPFVVAPTTCSQSGIDFMSRMWCTPTWPAATRWVSGQKCQVIMTRAVRRVAF